MKALKPLTVYGVTVFSNAALSFATFALLTHHLSEVDYGIINLYNSFIILLMPFISIGVPFVLNIDYFKMDHEEYSKQFTNALVIPFTAFLFFTLLLVLFHTHIERITKVNFFFTAIASFSCLLFVLNDVMLNLFRNKEKYFLYAGYSLTRNIIEVSFTIFLVIGLGYGWSGRLGSNLIALIAGGLVISYLVHKWHLFKKAFDKKVVLAILMAGLPFIPERLAIFVLGYSDRFFIDHFSGTADVGYYGAGAQLAMVVNLAILTLNNTFYPNIFKALTQHPVDNKKVKNVIFQYTGFSAFTTLAVILAVPYFFKFFIGPNFQPGKVYAIYLAIGWFLWSIYNVFVAFLLSLRKNKLIMRISIAGMILSVITNYISVKRFGAIGATYTSIMVYFFMAAATIFFVNRYFGIRKIFS